MNYKKILNNLFEEDSILAWFVNKYDIIELVDNPPYIVDIAKKAFYRKKNLKGLDVFAKVDYGIDDSYLAFIPDNFFQGGSNIAVVEIDKSGSTLDGVYIRVNFLDPATGEIRQGIYKK